MRKFAKAYFFMGIADLLGGIITLIFSFGVFVAPKFFINENGQYRRFIWLFNAIERLHIYGTNFLF